MTVRLTSSFSTCPLTGSATAGTDDPPIDFTDPPIDPALLERNRRPMRSDGRAVDQLPESLRRVVLLVYYQGLKYREAAQALSIPVGTVKSRLHAAIGKLNEQLQPTMAVHG